MPDGDECDGYFAPYGIPFDDAYQDEAVHTVRSDGTLSDNEKKWLILCWFDNTYGEWNGSRFDMRNSRAMMSAFLRSTPYATFEELFAAQEASR